MQTLIAQERWIIKKEKQIKIPEVYIFTVIGDTVNAFATKIDEEYYICINYGMIDRTREYLNELNMEEIQDKEEYISKLVEYL